MKPCKFKIGQEVWWDGGHGTIIETTQDANEYLIDSRGRYITRPEDALRIFPSIFEHNLRMSLLAK